MPLTPIFLIFIIIQSNQNSKTIKILHLATLQMASDNLSNNKTKYQK